MSHERMPCYLHSAYNCTVVNMGILTPCISRTHSLTSCVFSFLAKILTNAESLYQQSRPFILFPRQGEKNGKTCMGKTSTISRTTLENNIMMMQMIMHLNMEPTSREQHDNAEYKLLLRSRVQSSHQWQLWGLSLQNAPRFCLKNFKTTVTSHLLGEYEESHKLQKFTSIWETEKQATLHKREVLNLVHQNLSEMQLGKYIQTTLF